MEKIRVPSRAEFHVPKSMLGLTIPFAAGKEHYRLIRIDIEKYSNNKFHLLRLLQIVDDFDQTKYLGHARSMQVLDQVMTYLRIKLLLSDIYVVEKVAVLLDTLVKNCQYRVHLLVGSRNFMKTFGFVTRQLLIDGRKQHCEVGARMLDILQGWGEAFSQENRCKIYPHIVETYHKMQSKYGFTYQRAHFDPSRVPIFLGPLHENEIIESRWAGSCMTRNIYPFDCIPNLVDSSLYVHGGSQVFEEYTETPVYIDSLYTDFEQARDRKETMGRSDDEPPIIQLNGNKYSTGECRTRTGYPEESEKESNPENFLLPSQINKSVNDEFFLTRILEIVDSKADDENTFDATDTADELEVHIFDVACCGSNDSFNYSEPDSHRVTNDDTSGSTAAASSVDEMIIENKEFTENIQICRKESRGFAFNLKSSMSSVSDDLVDKIHEVNLPSVVGRRSQRLSLNTDNNENSDSINSIETLYSFRKTSHTGKWVSEALKSPSSVERGVTKYCMPSSDPTLEIKYFGHQRILVKKTMF